MTAVLTGHGLGDLLGAVEGHPFVRCEVTDELASTWWQAAGAVAFQRTRKAVQRTVNVLGDDAGSTVLLDHLPQIAETVAPGRRALSVSVPQHLEPLLRERYRVLEGGDWEWFHTTVAPAEHPSHERVVPLDDVARAREVRAFLETHSPTADTEPGRGERWFAVEEPDGALCAVAAWGVTRAGAPHLSSVAVDSGRRGQGLGRTIVGAVTRQAVLESGMATLGMYSHNTVARGLYLSLGYDRLCAWSSRPVLVGP